MPSSSARFTQLPRAIDKVPFYLALKKFRDHLKGDLSQLSEEEICFPDLDLKVVPKVERLAQEKAHAESNGQIWPIKQENDGETKPKRSRKKKTIDKPGECEAGGFTVLNEPGHAETVIKKEPEATVTTNFTVIKPVTTTPVTHTSDKTVRSNVEQILQQGGSLVKQEDFSELAQFGLNHNQLQQVCQNISATSRGQTSSVNYPGFWPPVCGVTSSLFLPQGSSVAHHSQYPLQAPPAHTGISASLAPHYHSTPQTMSSHSVTSAITSQSNSFLAHSGSQNQSHPYWSQFPNAAKNLSKK